MKFNVKYTVETENSTICMWGRMKGGEQWCRVSNVSIFSPRILYVHDHEYIRRIREYKGRRIYPKTVRYSLDPLDYSLSKFINGKERAGSFDVASRRKRKNYFSVRDYITRIHTIRRVTTDAIKL